MTKNNAVNVQNLNEINNKAQYEMIDIFLASHISSYCTVYESVHESSLNSTPLMLNASLDAILKREGEKRLSGHD